MKAALRICEALRQVTDVADGKKLPYVPVILGYGEIEVCG